MKIKNLTIIVVTLIIILLNGCSVYASTKSNYEIVKDYCKANYPNCKITIFKKYDADIIENRKDTNIVYVEKFVSYSKGKYGYSKNGYYVKYNKKVKKGKKVISYFIYNPYTNYCDDVVAVVDNHMIR